MVIIECVLTFFFCVGPSIYVVCRVLCLCLLFVSMFSFSRLCGQSINVTFAGNAGVSFFTDVLVRSCDADPLCLCGVLLCVCVCDCIIASFLMYCAGLCRVTIVV